MKIIFLLTITFFFVHYELNGQNLNIVWKNIPNEYIGSEAKVAIGSNDNLIVSNNKKVFALNKYSGKKIWESINIRNNSHISIDYDNSIYIGSDDQKVYAINSDGSVKWSFKISSSVSETGPTLSSDGKLYFGTNNGTFYCLTKSNGVEKWNIKLKGPIYSNAIITSDNSTLYVGGDDKYFYSISSDGNINWKFKTDGMIRASPSISYGDNIYFGSNDDNLYSLDKNGVLRWKYDTGGNILYSPVIDTNENIYIVNSNKKLLSITKKGIVRWSKLIDKIIGPPILTSEFLIVGQKVFSLSGNEINQLNLSGKIPHSATMTNDGYYFIGTTDSSILTFFTQSKITDAVQWPMQGNNQTGDGRSRVIPENPSIFLNGQHVNSQRFDHYEPVVMSIISQYVSGHIYYTLDGSEPDFSSNKYNNPLIVDESSEINVITYDEKYKNYNISDKIVFEIKKRVGLRVNYNSDFSDFKIIPSKDVYYEGDKITITATNLNDWELIGWQIKNNDGETYIKSNKHLEIELNSTTEITPDIGTKITINTLGNGSVDAQIYSNETGKFENMISDSYVRPFESIRLKAKHSDKSYFYKWAGDREDSTSLIYQQIYWPAFEVTALFTNSERYGTENWSQSIKAYDGRNYYYGPTINRKNNALYIGSYDHLFKYDINRNLLWKLPMSLLDDPIILNDGTLCALTIDSNNSSYSYYVTLIASNGIILKKFKLEGDLGIQGIYGRILIAETSSNQIIVCRNGSLILLDRTSLDVIRKITYDSYHSSVASLLVAKDDLIYISSNFPDIERKKFKIVCLNLYGREIWGSEFNLRTSLPALGDNGIIYMGCGWRHNNVLAVNRHNGLIISEFSKGIELNQDRWGNFIGNVEEYSPTILGQNGNIYVAKEDGYVYCVNSEGKELWKHKVDVDSNSGIESIVAGNANIYVGVRDGSIYSINESGQKNWSFKRSGNETFSSSLIIDDHGSLYYVSSDDNIGYLDFTESLLYSINTKSTGPAHSAWPMYAQNSHRNRRVSFIGSDYVKINRNINSTFPFTLKFFTTKGLRYEFQASSDLMKWSKLQEVKGTGNDVEVSDQRKAIFRQQYYRIKLVE